MSRTNTLRTVALLFLVPVAAQAAPQSGAPDLRHVTAPFVGRTLTLEVQGAAPLAAIDLYFSQEPGSSTTPYGVLELRRNALQLLASGTTTATGAWSFDLTIPLQASLAETGAHFQALIDDSSAPAGRIFSDAIHARFLGPRMYAGYRGVDPFVLGPRRFGMYILSGLTESVVASVDYGITNSPYADQHEGKPVFDATYSRGAVMSTGNELLYFDPYFGGVQGRTAFASTCSRTLFTDAARRTLYVLETAGTAASGRIHAIDIASGAETAHLDLPNVVEPLWCLGRAASEVFVAEHETGGRTAIRWIGLSPLVDRGSIQVGGPESTSFLALDKGPPPHSTRVPLVFAGGQVFAATSGDVGMYKLGSLTRFRATSAGFTTDTTALGTAMFHVLAAVPGADRVLAGWGRTDMGPFFLPFQIPITTIAPPSAFPAAQGSTEFWISEIEPDGEDAWIIAETEWQHSDVLFRLDVGTHAWTQYPVGWLYGPSDAAVLRDAWNHELWVSNVGVGPPVNLAPEILVVDEVLGTMRHIPLGKTVEVLHAVPLP